MKTYKVKICLLVAMSFMFCHITAQDYEKKGDLFFNDGNYGQAVRCYGQVHKPVNATAFEYKESKAKEYRMIMMEGDNLYRQGYYEDARNVYYRLLELHSTRICRSKIDSCNLKIEAVELENQLYNRLRYEAEGREFYELSIEYCNRFPNGGHYDEVKANLDYCDDRLWQEAEQEYKIEYYKTYLEVLPDGIHIEEAKERISELDEKAWREAKQTNTIDSYKNYISAGYNVHKKEAQNRIDGIMQEERDYKRCKASFSESEIRAFLDKYPNSKHTDEINKRLAFVNDENAWKEAQDINTIESYEQYYNGKTIKQHSYEARQRMYELRDYQLWLVADSVNTILSYEQYIEACNICKHKQIAAGRKIVLSDQQQLISEAWTLYQKKKYEEAYNIIIEAENKGEMPDYYLKTALTCKEPYEYKQAMKSKDKNVVELYIKTYIEVAPEKHIDKASRKMGKM